MASYTRFIGMRYGFSRQRSRFTALVSIASMLGMMLGVASLITVLSVMNGFASELRGRILALVPHAFVVAEATPGAAAASPRDTLEALSQRVSASPAVLATAPFMEAKVLFSGPYSQRGAQLYGIDREAQILL